MGDETKERPHVTGPAAEAAAARRDRLAAALRENLRKRKQQARARDPGKAAGKGEPENR